jgi:hypothetical protein
MINAEAMTGPQMPEKQGIQAFLTLPDAADGERPV